ncbi:hypothetical protein B7463_g2724, partial [Scytalidium lignicola]
MGGKRKRKRPCHLTKDAPGEKCQRIGPGSAPKDPLVKQAVLAIYYPKVCTLREYLISKLPPGSKIRRKKILSIGRQSKAGSEEEHAYLASFMDRCLVGVLQNADVSETERLKQWATFSQRGENSVSGFADYSGATSFSQPEIVDFCIWLLFAKTPFGYKNNHLLCKGFRRDVSSFSVQRGEFPTSALPGIVSTYPNSNVTAIKAAPWTKLLPLMGKDCEKTMIDLILDCGIFVPVESSRGSYFQLSGKPLGDLSPLPQASVRDQTSSCSGGTVRPTVTPGSESNTDHTPANIIFVRSRILYARAALNSRREVSFGLRHIHALNRYRLNPVSHNLIAEDTKDKGLELHGQRQQSTIMLLMYIFPRQFGLHNVFTSVVDYRDTAQQFQDYTLREEEIDAKFRSQNLPPLSVKVPKRLRGKPSDLVEKFQSLHRRCPYKKLLEYYCPAYSRYTNHPCLLDEGEMKYTDSTRFETQLHMDGVPQAPTSSSPIQLTIFETNNVRRSRTKGGSKNSRFTNARIQSDETSTKGDRDEANYESKAETNEKIHDVLAFEKTSRPDRLGSSLFSVGELYYKLKQFKDSLAGTNQPLYFAKVDVQAAFDTIPQAAVIHLTSKILSEYDYYISKHVEMKPADNSRGERGTQVASKPIRRWRSLAGALSDVLNFKESLESKLAVGRKNTVFVSNIVNLSKCKDELLQLLEEHVTCNMVKIGNKFYRQKEGIPQGSVLSSFLCNYFYADLEANHLSFLQNENCLLLRLIDDFLLITTDRSHAKDFLQKMHQGFAEYGVSVNPNKTLTNFEVAIDNNKVPRVVDRHNFPYCGIFINPKSLELSKNREKKGDTEEVAIVDSITVEFSRSPKRVFYKKALNAFKIQAHAMFFDTSLNSVTTVLSNIYSAFIETATKMWAYARCLPLRNQPSPKLVIKTIQDLIKLAFCILRSKGKNEKNKGYRCGVSRAQVEW